VWISEIEDLPNSVKKQLFDELLDANAQKGCTLLDAKFSNTLLRHAKLSVNLEDFVKFDSCRDIFASGTCKNERRNM